MANKATDTRPQFFLIEDAIVDKANLDPYSGWLYVIIAKHADRTTGEAFPGIARLAKLASMSRSQVLRAIKILEDKKLIRVERDELPNKGEKRQREKNHYFLLSASGSAYQTLGVVSMENYPSSSQTLGVVSGVDHNKNQYNKESNNNKNARANPLPEKQEIVISKKKTVYPADFKKWTRQDTDRYYAEQDTGLTALYMAWYPNTVARWQDMTLGERRQHIACYVDLLESKVPLNAFAPLVKFTRLKWANVPISKLSEYVTEWRTITQNAANITPVDSEMDLNIFHPFDPPLDRFLKEQAERDEKAKAS